MIHVYSPKRMVIDSNDCSFCHACHRMDLLSHRFVVQLLFNIKRTCLLSCLFNFKQWSALLIKYRWWNNHIFCSFCTYERGCDGFSLCAFVVLYFPRLSAGTAHGLTVIDYIQRNVVLTKCTLNANGITLKIYFCITTLKLNKYSFIEKWGLCNDQSYKKCNI